MATVLLLGLLLFSPAITKHDFKHTMGGSLYVISCQLHSIHEPSHLFTLVIARAVEYVATNAARTFMDCNIYFIAWRITGDVHSAGAGV